MKYVPKTLDKNVNVSEASPLVELITLIGGIAAIMFIVYLALGVASDQIIDHYGEELEDILVGYSLPQAKAGNSDTESELQNIVDAMASNLPGQAKKFSLSLVEGDTVNAISLPGRRIVVFQGLVDNSDSSEELAMIIGHELGHFESHDHLRGLGRAIVFVFVSSLLFGDDSAAKSFFDSSVNIAEYSYSREQEYHADEIGLELFYKTYGSVRGATDFFEKMKSEDPSIKGAEFFMTHPNSAARVKRIEELIQLRRYKK